MLRIDGIGANGRIRDTVKDVVVIIQVTDDGGLEGWSNRDDENENTHVMYLKIGATEKMMTPYLS